MNSSKKTTYTILALAIFEIVLLLTLPYFESRVLLVPLDANQPTIISQTAQKFSKSLINSITTFLTIPQIGLVSAQTLSTVCCPQSKSGERCVEIPANLANSTCAVSSVPGSCKAVSSCQVGCCFDTVEGTCSPNTLATQCQSAKSVFTNDATCSTPNCVQGCCVLGNDVNFVTERRCERISLLQGQAKDFRSYQSELQCLTLKKTQTFGACVLTGGACSLRTETACLQSQGTFFKNYLCSNPSLKSLGVTCEPQKQTACFDGFDEAYWVDSCGNRENIFDNDKTKSFNSGLILSKNNSCGIGGSNANSATCGNCNTFEGSRCQQTSTLSRIFGKNETAARCISLDCKDSSGKTRKNGESWCEYDGTVGDGKDPVGSRHFKYQCLNGEVRPEPCGDYRGEVCTESVFEESGKKFSQASCVTNKAMSCILEYNTPKKLAECEKNPQCMIKKVDVSSGFKFNVCVGRYPPGFTQRSESSTSNNLFCSIGTRTCTVIYQKGLFSGWKCIQNCECETKKFTEQMNDLCTSLGDCGSYVNYLGKGTDNIEVSNAPKISWTKYISFAQSKKDQKVVVDTSDILKATALTENILDNVTEQKSQTDAIISSVGKISGVSGQVASAASFVFGSNILLGSDAIFLGSGEMVANPTGYQGIAQTLGASDAFGVTRLAGTLGAVGGAVGGISTGIMVGSFIAKQFKLSGDAYTAVVLSAAIAGGITGGVLGFGSATGVGIGGAVGGFASGLVGGGVLGALAAGLAVFAIVAIVAIIVAIIVVLVMKALGVGKIKKIKVKFTCEAWQAPLGGSDCSKCNDNPLKPCSQYRCESLGQACALINEFSDRPTCIALKNDGQRVIVSPKNISEGFSFFNNQENFVEIKTSQRTCISEGKTVLFSLATNKDSVCRWDIERKDAFENYTGTFASGNSFVSEHISGFMMPPIAQLEYELNTSISRGVGALLANATYYVSCRDRFGNNNPLPYRVSFCVKEGPDVTPVEIYATSPPNQATLPKDVTSVNLTIYLSEPAECRYDTQNKTYEQMQKNFVCETGLQDLGDYGWPCQAVVPAQNGSVSIGIRCSDQPWFTGVNETLRNVNTESYWYTLFPSKGALKISTITPSSTIKAGIEPFPIVLQVKTEGGADGLGSARCEYRLNDQNTFTSFFETGANTHTQNLDFMVRGTYKTTIRCEDAAGNIAEKETTFKLELDTNPPRIIRIFDQGTLKLVTDEQAICYYDLRTCNFNLQNASEITVGFSTIHETPFESGRTYYIKCKDVFGNTNPTCAARITRGI